MKKILARIKAGLGSLFRTAMGGNWANEILHNDGRFSTKKLWYQISQLNGASAAVLCNVALFIEVLEFMDGKDPNLGAIGVLATVVLGYATKCAVMYLQGKKIDNGGPA